MFTGDADDKVMNPNDTPAQNNTEDETPPQNDEVTNDVQTKNNERKDDGPPPDHPRFKEIYWKMKEFERQLAEKEQAIKMMQEHNRMLQESLSKVEEQFDEQNRPDPVEDPNGFAKWMYEKAMRDLKKQQVMNTTFDPTSQPDPNSGIGPTMPMTQTPDMQRLLIQEEVQRNLHADYDEVIAEVNEDMTRDPVLRNQIWSSPNPAAEAYKYGVEKRKRMSSQRQAQLNQGYVEGSTPPADNDQLDKPTPEQERIARALGIPIKDYMEQLRYIQKQRRQ